MSRYGCRRMRAIAWRYDDAQQEPSQKSAAYLDALGRVEAAEDQVTHAWARVRHATAPDLREQALAALRTGIDEYDRAPAALDWANDAYLQIKDQRYPGE